MKLGITILMMTLLIMGCGKSSNQSKNQAENHQIETKNDMNPDAPVMPDYKQFDLTTTKSGLQYYDITPGNGETPSQGDYVYVQYAGWLPDGKLFDTSYKRGQSFSFELGAGRVIPGWDEGLSTMKVGGKRLLVLPPDLAYGTRGAPPAIPPNSTLVFQVELEKVQSKPQMPDLSSLKFKTTDSGLKYADVKKGKGDQPKTGQEVKVHYTGWLKDGKFFDSSVTRNRPFTFKVGMGGVIKGWDEGVASMRTGGKRILMIPPELGYGARGVPPTIPANSTLVFEVELLDIIG